MSRLGHLLLGALPTLLLSGCVQDWSRAWRDRSLWVTVPSGRFMMGSPPGENCHLPAESERSVVVSRRFELMRSEVRQAEFQQRMGFQPSKSGCSDPSCPVDNVSWHEAAAFCNVLSRQAGLVPCYSCTSDPYRCIEGASFVGPAIYTCPGYRLPTDAEWERACRAGSSSAFYGGPISSCEGADPVADLIAWYDGNAGKIAHPVGGKLANAWGLQDMSGNVLEWCNDGRFENVDPEINFDPVGPLDTRALRGGSYLDPPKALRAAAERLFPPVFRSSGTGFRCARTTPVALQSVLNEVLLPQKEGDYALDLDGLGPKNQLGNLIALVTELGVDLGIEKDLARGQLLIVLELFGTSLTEQAEATLQAYRGLDLDGDPKNNFSGSAQLGIHRASIFDATVQGSLHGGRLIAAGRMPFPLPAALGSSDPLMLWRGRMEANISSAGIKAVVGGAVSTFDVENSLLPAIAKSFTWTIDPRNSVSPTLRKLIRDILDQDKDGKISVEELKQTVAASALTPDIDIDGDGKLDGYSLGVAIGTTTCQIVR